MARARPEPSSAFPAPESGGRVRSRRAFRAAAPGHPHPEGQALFSACIGNVDHVSQMYKRVAIFTGNAFVINVTS